MSTPLKTPVAFIIFNRPKCTRKVFESIRDARPEKLYLIADAARTHKPGEAEKCAETRRLVEQLIDWPCEVHKNYADNNLGCRERIITGLRWVFDQEEEAIILEDDIVPDPTFFPFCAAMLARYRNNDQVMLVAGFNELNFQPSSGDSCFFSKYTPIWGWATWRRAWALYQPKRLDWEVEKEIIRRNSGTRQEAGRMIAQVEQVEAGQLDTWDFHWRAAVLIHGGLTAIPSRNLVRNIGFNSKATHTKSAFNPDRLHRLASLPPPYQTPKQVAVATGHDRRLRRRHAAFGWMNALHRQAQRLATAPKRLKRRLANIFPRRRSSLTH